MRKKMQLTRLLRTCRVLQECTFPFMSFKHTLNPKNKPVKKKCTLIRPGIHMVSSVDYLTQRTRVHDVHSNVITYHNNVVYTLR